MRGTECAAHKHRSPVPLERHHIQPQSRDGKTVLSNLVTICGNTHGNVHYLLDRIEDEAMSLMSQGRRTFPPYDAYLAIPKDIRNSYSLVERRIALRGWGGYGARFVRGEFTTRYSARSTSGQDRVKQQIHESLFLPNSPFLED